MIFGPDYSSQAAPTFRIEDDRRHVMGVTGL
jgi:hypothetical protein